MDLKDIIELYLHMAKQDLVKHSQCLAICKLKNFMELCLELLIKYFHLLKKEI